LANVSGVTFDKPLHPKRAMLMNTTALVEDRLCRPVNPRMGA
jgi:hypothetical protein